MSLINYWTVSSQSFFRAISVLDANEASILIGRLASDCGLCVFQGYTNGVD